MLARVHFTHSRLLTRTSSSLCEQVAAEESKVAYHVRPDGVAVLTVCNPPVNSLSQKVLADLFSLRLP